MPWKILSNEAARRHEKVMGQGYASLISVSILKKNNQIVVNVLGSGQLNRLFSPAKIPDQLRSCQNQNILLFLKDAINVNSVHFKKPSTQFLYGFFNIQKCVYINSIFLITCSSRRLVIATYFQTTSFFNSAHVSFLIVNKV